jgi:erythromycin esterase-like protein
MLTRSIPSAPSVVASVAKPISDGHDELLDCIGDSEIVLIGEASHGTHDFYSLREKLTRRLIAEKGFRIVALEADWPDALRINRYVNGCGNDKNANEALSGFRRFPSWMWRNTVMEEFIGWMKDWNDDRSGRDTAGIFGMDLYSMHTSMDAVLEYLDAVDPEAANRARHRYSCFEQFNGDPQQYGYMTSSGGAEPCKAAVVKQLVELRERRMEWIRRDGKAAEDEYFYAEQNARLVVNAEEYYRSMFMGRRSSWNLRDQHMTGTLAALKSHFGKGDGKMVVWAHNSHLGDARATEMVVRGEVNVGQLMRQQFGSRVFNIGFSTYTGTVTAARNWGDPAECRRVVPGLPGSYEALFHDTGLDDFWIDLREEGTIEKVLEQERLQRAIGVIYRPETERYSHYFRTSLPKQFDVMIHMDETRALEPLESISEWDEDELPETYPGGL